MIANIQLSKNFWLHDYLKSAAAERQPNLQLYQFNPPGYVIENIKKTNELMQKIRDWYGLPIRITSGYRCKEVNSLIGGSSTSQHIQGEAADFEPLSAAGREVDGKEYKRIAQWILLNLSFRQLIKEYGTAADPSWLHLAQRMADNKKQCLEVGAHTGWKYVALDFDKWKP